MTTAAGDTTQAPTAATEQCGQCGAPAYQDQRYCLNCGFHRRNAPDPVARYLSEASAARTRVAAADALSAQRRRRPRIAVRLAVALVALALLVGILIGNATAGGSGSAGRARPAHATQRHAGSRSKKTTTLGTKTGSSYRNQENSLPSSVTP